jgi:hypothetical protein
MSTPTIMSLLLLTATLFVGSREKSATDNSKSSQASVNKDGAEPHHPDSFVGTWSSVVTSNTKTLHVGIELRQDGSFRENGTLTTPKTNRQYVSEGTWRVLDNRYCVTLTNSTLEKVTKPEEESYKLISSTPEEFSYQTEKRLWLYKRKK